MFESYFPHAVASHEAAFVNICVYAVYASLCRVLPHGVIPVVGEFWHFVGVLGNHEGVAVYFPLQVLVVEVSVGVEQGFLAVSFFYKLDEFDEMREYYNNILLPLWKKLRIELEKYAVINLPT